MFEFLRRKNAQAPDSEEEPKAIPETTSASDAPADDEALRSAVGKALADEPDEEPDPTPEPELALCPTVNTIGPDTRIGGSISTKSAVRVLGEIEGDVECVSLLVEEDGQVNGDVKVSGEALVRGDIVGDVVVEGKLSIAASGRVNGGVTAHAIEIEEGGQLRGRCSMSSPSNLSVVSA